MELCQHFQERISLKPCVERIPIYSQNGLTMTPLHLTCLDTFPDHLVIGTNIGVIYVIHLPSYGIIKYKTENLNSIECVSAVKSVDEMIAAGCQNGSIDIFQKYSSSNNHSPLMLSQGTSILDKSEKYQIPRRFHLSIHTTSVCSLTWSKNGMKLFSGDTLGNICLCEIDFEKNRCIGRFLLKVNSRIVQLSYSHQILAISDLDSCIFYDTKNESEIQIGKKPRHSQGLFGCVFNPSTEYPKLDILYCVRSSNKIWSVNIQGEVMYSYIQKNLPPSAEIRLISSESSSETRGIGKVSFNYLLHFKGSCLICYSKSSLYIIDVKEQAVIGFCHSFADILGVAIEGNNIIILDIERNIVCLSTSTPQYGVQIPSIMSQSLNIPLQESLNLASLSKLKSKVQLPSNIMDGIAKIGGTVVSKISELAEPHIIKGSTTEEVESGMHERSHSRHHSEYDIEASPENEVFGNSSFIEGVFQGECENNSKFLCSDIEVTQNGALDLLREVKERSCHSDVAASPFINDIRTYDDFKHRIEENEHLLASVLDLNCLILDHQKESSVIGQRSPENVPLSTTDNSFLGSDLLGGSLSCSNLSANENDIENSILDIPFQNFYSIFPRERAKSLTENNCSQDYSTILTSKETHTMPPPDKLLWDWEKHRLPGKPIYLCGSDSALYFTQFCNKTNLYSSFDFGMDIILQSSWTKLLFTNGISSFSFRGNDILIQSLQGYIYLLDWHEFLSTGCLSQKLLINDNQIISFGLNFDLLWVLHRSKKIMVYFLSKPEKEKVIVSCSVDYVLKKLMVVTGVIWGLTVCGKVLYRIGVTSDVPTGVDWGSIIHPTAVVDIHLSEVGFGLMVDCHGDIYIAFHVSQKSPKGFDGYWWQLGIDREVTNMLRCNNVTTSEVDARNSSTLLMTSNNSYLFLSQSGLPFVYSLPLRFVLGHRFTNTECKNGLALHAICGKGIVKSFGILYGIDGDGELYAMSPQSDWIVSINLPRGEKVVSLSSHPGALWVVCKSGRVFLRVGISGSSIRGSGWKQLNLQQIDDIHLTHLSISSEVIWVVDLNGQIYMRQGNLNVTNRSLNGLVPAWLQIDTDELVKGASFIKVYVGYESDMVWGIDSEHRIYVRAHIFPDFATGSHWVHVPGLLAQSIAISRDRVFAVSYEMAGESKIGFIYERVGVYSDDFLGSAWKIIPSGTISFKDLTVSEDNTLWGLSENGKLYQHYSKNVDQCEAELLESQCSESTLIGASIDPEEWELV